MNPKRQKLILISIAIVIFGLIFLTTKLTQKTSYVAGTPKTTSNKAFLAIDSDNDGLKDWEEQLWKTDSHNPDSDGDGVMDGAEIKSGRNPTFAGPNDKLDQETVGSKINSQTEQDLTDTDKFSRELFVKVIASGNSENPPTEADFQEFLNKAIKNEIDTQKLKTYSESDLNLITEESTEIIKNYGNSIASLLKKPPTKKLEYEIEIVNRAEESKKPAELEKLNDNIAAYKKIGASLLAMKVPKSAVPFHLALINSTEAMAWSINGLKYILTDPIKALPGVASYADSAKNFPDSVTAFKTYFISKDVVFGKGEDGYQFFDKL